MGGACNTYGEKILEGVGGSLEEKVQFVDLGVDGRIILE
jgi:hypothetical protein